MINTTEYRTLQLVFTSTKVFDNGNLPLEDDLFSEMALYVVVSLPGNEEFKIPVKGCNFRVKFTFEEALLQQDRLTLFVKLCYEHINADTVIDLGEIHIPVRQLLNLTDDNLLFKHVSYLFRESPSGNPRGVIDFSYKFNEKFMCSVKSFSMPKSRCSRPRPSERQEGFISRMLYYVIEQESFLSLSRKELRTGFRIGILGMLFGFLIGGNTVSTREQFVLMFVGLIFKFVICSFMIVMSVFSLE